MKKLTALFLALILLVGASNIVATAVGNDLDATIKDTHSGSCGDNLTWNLNTSTGVLVIDGTGEMSSCPWSTFANSITEVQMSNGVTTIADSAFRQCKITYFEMPNSVTKMGPRVFYECNSLEEVKLSSNLTDIGQYAFWQCLSLTKIDIPNSVTKIGQSAFGFCINLGTIIIGSGVSSIGWGAFYLGRAFYSGEKIYYAGTVDQWAKIKISSYNFALNTDTITFNYKATTEAPDDPEPTYPDVEKGNIGDVNGDNSIDNLDAAIVLKYDAGLTNLSSDQKSNADVNEDGYVDNLDAAMILKYDAGLIPSL